MKMRKAIEDAIINGVVIGALVAGVMILSSQYSAMVTLRVTGAAMLIRFAAFMIENVDDVDAGMVGEYLGVPTTGDKERQILSFFRAHRFAKLI